MQVILHIGMHKTGSTSIQSALQTGVTGLGFPSVGRKNNYGRAFARAFAKAATPDAQKVSDETRALLAQEIKDCKEDVFLISGERISIASAETLTRFREFIMPLCDSLRVIGYVRPPHGLMQSHFQQHLKGGLSGTYYSFEPEKLYHNYRRRFEKFDEVFGKDHVTLKVFDRSCLTDGDIVADFFTEIGLDVPQMDNTEANTSMSLETVSLLYTMRKFGPKVDFNAPGVSRREGRVVTRMSRIKGRSFSISPTVTAPIIEAHKDDIQWMEERLGAPMSENLTEKPDAVVSEDDFLRVAMEVADEALKTLGLKAKHEVTKPKQLGRVLAKMRDKDDRKQVRKKGAAETARPANTDGAEAKGASRKGAAKVKKKGQSAKTADKAAPKAKQLKKKKKALRAKRAAQKAA